MRGLKLYRHIKTIRASGSHPTWVRGLKLSYSANPQHKKVAPYVGAWIETVDMSKFVVSASVAPYVGAWIETCG